MDIKFISLKFIDITFIKFKKTSKWKKVTYLLIYEKSSMIKMLLSAF